MSPWWAVVLPFFTVRVSFLLYKKWYLLEVTAKLLGGPPRFLLVLWMNSWFLLAHCSSANIIFWLGKSLLKALEKWIIFVQLSNKLYLLIRKSVIFQVRTLKHYGECYTIFLNKNQISIIYPMYFHLHSWKNCKCYIAYQRNSLEFQKPAAEVLTEFRSRSTYSSFSKNFIISIDKHPCNDDLRPGILLLFLYGGNLCRTVGFLYGYIYRSFVSFFFASHFLVFLLFLLFQ